MSGWGSGFRDRRLWRHILLYAVILAAGTALLSWLDFNLYARLHSEQLYIGLIALAFLIIGVVVGIRLTAPGPGHPNGNPAARQMLGITEREMEVLRALAHGLSTREVADRLGVSPNTIKTHSAKLFEKLDARRRTDAIQRARELGLID